MMEFLLFLDIQDIATALRTTIISIGASVANPIEIGSTKISKGARIVMPTTNAATANATVVIRCSFTRPPVVRTLTATETIGKNLNFGSQP